MQMLLFELEGVVGLSRKGSSPVAPSSPSSSSSELTQNNQFKLWNVYTADMTASVFQPLTPPPPNPTRFQAEIFSCPGDRDLTLSPVSSRWQSSVWVSWFPPRFASWGLKILTRPLAVGAKTEGITERLTRVIAALKIKKKKKKEKSAKWNSEVHCEEEMFLLLRTLTTSTSTVSLWGRHGDRIKPPL